MTEFNQRLRPGTWWGPVWGSPSLWTSPCSVPDTGQLWWPWQYCGISPGTTDRTGWAEPSDGCGWSRLSVQHIWTPHVNLTWIWHDIKFCDTNPSIRSLNCSKLASEARNSSLSFSDWPGGYNHWHIYKNIYKISRSASWWHTLVTCEDVTIVVIHLDIRLGTHSVRAEDRDRLTNYIMGN